MLRVARRQTVAGRLSDPGEEARLFHRREAGSGRHEKPDEPRPRLLRLARPQQPPQLVEQFRLEQSLTARQLSKLSQETEFPPGERAEHRGTQPAVRAVAGGDA